MWRSPVSCASCIPACRSTGSPSIRSPGCWRLMVSAFTRPAHTWPMSPGTSSPSRPNTTHCFQAIRRMDEILLANFMVFHDLAREEDYDLWIGDEAWELDYYLHENPEQ